MSAFFIWNVIAIEYLIFQIWFFFLLCQLEVKCVLRNRKLNWMCLQFFFIYFLINFRYSYLLWKIKVNESTSNKNTLRVDSISSFACYLKKKNYVNKCFGFQINYYYFNTTLTVCEFDIICIVYLSKAFQYLKWK